MAGNALMSGLKAVQMASSDKLASRRFYCATPLIKSDKLCYSKMCFDIQKSDMGTGSP